jgi:hypothetical protein
MNPTKELISYISDFLDMIPERFVEKSIPGDYSSATIKIVHPVHPDSQVLMESRRGVVTVRFNDVVKRYQCNVFSYKRQVRKAWGDMLTLIPDDGKVRKPILNIGQYAMSFCEPKTGIVLEIETLKRRIGWGDIYKIFKTKEQAMAYADLLVKDQDIECILYDNEYQYIQSIGRL